MRRIFLKKKVYFFVFIFVSLSLLFIGLKMIDRTNLSYLQKTEKALSLASSDIDSLRSYSGSDIDVFTEILDMYAEHISSVFSYASEIQEKETAKQSFLTIFKSLSSQLNDLRTIEKRSSLKNILQNYGILEKIKDENISIQEKAVESLATLLQADESSDSTKTQTETMLACPDCNVVLISLTTLRPDRMSIYGYKKETTPNIDAFFHNSLIFRNTVAPTSWTTPNAISLFTSLFPYRHGIIDRELSPLYNRQIFSLPEMLKKNGYTTAAFTGGGDYNDKYNGFSRGFDFYLDEKNYAEFQLKAPVPMGIGLLSFSPLREFLPMGTDWLNINYQKKFFLLLQGYDTHCPLDPREPFASQFTKGMKSDKDFSLCHWTHEDTAPSYENGKKYWKVKIQKTPEEIVEVMLSQEDLDYMNALYDARIAEMDFYLNNFFEKAKSLGLEKNTVFILMSDHGEMLGEHGRFMRGGTVRGNSYKESLNFPLLIKHPNIKDPLVIDDIVQTTDIMPTLLSLLGIQDPQKDIREGKPLQISNFGDTPVNEYGFSGAQYKKMNNSKYFAFPNASESIQDKQWKLIKETIFEDNGFDRRDVSYKLFHLTEDPGENINLYDTEKEEAEKLKVKLEQWLDNYR